MDIMDKTVVNHRRVISTSEMMTQGGVIWGRGDDEKL